MINIFLFSFFSSIYIFCAGVCFNLKKNIEAEEIYLSIFFGSFILSIIAVFLNFIVPLSVGINSVVFVLILIIGIYLIFKKGIFSKLLFSSILIALISTLIISFDTIYRPDANLYHLPYTRIINENKIIFGISNIHFRFGHTSILQYLNAIFNNALFKEKGILIPAAIIFSSVILYFYKEITKNLEKNKIYSYYVFLLLSFILLAYNRYSEFGNDTIAHLIFFVISSLFIKNSFEQNEDNQIFSKILLLSLFCFMLKTSLVFVFLIPLYIFIFNFKKNYLNNFLNLLIFIIILSWFTKNIIVSGCFIYPVEITCFEKLQWFTNNTNHLISAKMQSLDNEAWTKGWPNYKGFDVSQEFYVKKFFWIKTWLSVHGLLISKKISVFIFILIIINYFLKNIEKSPNIKKNKINNKIIFLFFMSLICTLIWFVRFPIFRYGSSYLAVLIVSIATLVAVKNRLIDINKDKFNKFLKTSLIIFFIAFSLKHILRISKTYDGLLSENIWPNFPKTEDTSYISSPKIIDNFFAYNHLKSGIDGCGYTQSPCSPYPVKNVKFKKLYGYKFFYLEN